MSDERDDDESVSISAAIAPTREGLASFREMYAQEVQPCDIDLTVDGPARWRLTSASMGATVVAAVESTPMRWFTSSALAQTLPSGLMFDVVIDGAYDYVHASRQVLAEKGDVAVYSRQLATEATARTSLHTRTLLLPEESLRPFGDFERLAGLKLPASLAEARLLGAYVSALNLEEPTGTAAFRALIGNHLRDLAIAGLSRVLKLEDPTAGSGVRAARIARLKRLIDEQIGNPNLNAARLARQLDVSERYVQLLFEETGATISAYIMEKRLTLAFGILARNADPETSIRDIGYLVGFSDPSHFTRAFRRRFGETPGGVRGIEARG
ncbi:MAG TPA: helix-turn-helix transcriptional regulator, partial [Methylomirabilota bacterium]|nr:helix-turn-helix transcriptional regulator [Methylomirabilota bacterium]